MRRLTKEEFVARAQAIHNFKYTYDNFIYSGSTIKGNITCPSHGDFLQDPSAHIFGKNGCPQCGRNDQIKARAHTKEIFVEVAVKIHGDKFDYSLVEYVNSMTHVLIKCNTCGDILSQVPNSHLAGDGCVNCAGLKRRDNASFIVEARLIHGDLYDYSLVEYVNSNEKVIIICPKHGNFLQTPLNHLNMEHGCPICGGTGKLTLEKVIERANKIHNHKYIYDKLVFVNVSTKGTIGCPEHGYFEQKINDHLRGIGCQDCSARKNEKIVGVILKSLDIQYVSQYKINLFGTYRSNAVDYYLPKLNLIIEYNGAQHYRPVNYGRFSDQVAEERFVDQQRRDDKLRQYCSDNHINLLEIDGRLYREAKLIEYLTEQLVIY
jgi:hypothetical protein